jgi:hypothetical protein
MFHLGVFQHFKQYSNQELPTNNFQAKRTMGTFSEHKEEFLLKQLDVHDED